MCGIVGYTGRRNAAPVVISGLRRLEYRGYDSAGIAALGGGRLEVRKAVGGVARLEKLLGATALTGTVALAHTRWATHGRPSETNAHPHTDCHGRLAIVHNGIIENYRELRRRLAAAGHRFRSETDTEVIAHLIEHCRSNSLEDSLRRAARELRGSYAVACVAVDTPETVVAIRGGSSPLIIGIGTGEMFLASDIPALLGETREVVSLPEGGIAVLTPEQLTVTGLDGAAIRVEPTTIPWSAEAAQRDGFPDFMLKEIFEQPDVIRNTLRDRTAADDHSVHIPELGLRDRDLASLNRLCFVACGTSWHAALVGKYLVEAFARLPVEVDIASEFRYRQPIVDSRVLTVPISQSGETADTLAALREARARGSRTVAICNVVGSSLAREADGVLYTRAGIEIGVASTKAFTAQLTAVTLLALKLGLARGFADAALVREVMKSLQEIPDLMPLVLEQTDSIRQIATRFAASQGFLYLGRGVNYPLALEGALKLKEISYIHAEGYAGGELKHGPIALVDERMPVVALVPQGMHYEKTMSNLEEVKARGGIVVAIATQGDDQIAERADLVISVPPSLECTQPLLLTPVLQLLAYHLGIARGCDVDRPRNLAKSVTVE